MEEFSSEDIEAKKNAIFDAMGTRGQNKIMKSGYEKWNPFAEPKDPIDIRRDQTKRTSQMLIREFLQNADHEDYSPTFGQGALDMCFGIINKEEKVLGMYAFACWYRDLLLKEGHDVNLKSD